MKQVIQMEGLVLKTTDYKEQAVIAQILTTQGLKNYIIRGAKKMASGTRLLASPLTRIQFNATSSDGLDTITEGVIQESYLLIKQNIQKMLCIYPILEKILIFTNQVTNIALFYSFVLEILDLLSSNLDEKVILTIFEVKLTYLIGIAPELKICTQCGNKITRGYFSVYNGGVYCPLCARHQPYELNEEETEALRLLYLVKLNKVDTQFIDIVSPSIIKISNIIDLYYQKHLDFMSKAKEVTKQIIV